LKLANNKEYKTGSLEIFEILDVQGRFHIVLELLVQVAFGIHGPAFETSDIVGQRLGGREAGVGIIFEIHHLHEALVHFSFEMLVLVFRRDDDFGKINDPLLQFRHDVVFSHGLGCLESDVPRRVFEQAASGYEAMWRHIYAILGGAAPLIPLSTAIADLGFALDLGEQAGPLIASAA